MKFLLAKACITGFLLLTCNMYLICAQSEIPDGIVVQLKSENLLSVFNQIQEQTNYTFAYNSLELDDKNKFIPTMKKQKLNSVLADISKEYSLVFNVIAKVIYVKKSTQKKAQIKSKSELKPTGEGILFIDRILSGKVRSEEGEPLIGATVKVKSTNIGTITDVEGSFTLNIPTEAQFLVISYVGFHTKEVKIDKQVNLNISLKTDAVALEEVIVVGYGTQKKGDVSTSIASINGANIAAIPTPSFDQAISGRLAGVKISQTTGAPGGNTSIRVRGTSSISAGNNPLIVVDGIPLSDETQNGFGNTSRDYVEQPINPLSTIDINDIESIEVLKDASSSAIYGSRGSNGVVLITTKKGQKGKSRITYNTYFGIQQVLNKVDVLNAQEWAELHAQAKNNAYLDNVEGADINDDSAMRHAKATAAGFEFGDRGSFIIPNEVQAYIDGQNNLNDTDWQDAIFRNSLMQYHNVSISGGTEDIKYFASGNFLDQKGVVINSRLKRYGGRFNLEGNINSRLKFGFRINPSVSQYDLVDSEGPLWDEGVIASALSYAPIFPVKDDDGSFNHGMTDWWAQFNGLVDYTIANPVELTEKIQDNLVYNRMYANTHFSYEFLDGLSYRVSLGTETNDIRRDYFHPKGFQTLWWYRFSGADYAYSSSSKSVNWIVENTLSYEKTIGENQISAIVGTSAQKENLKFSESRAGYGDIPNDLVPTLNAATNIRGLTREEEWSVLSYLARVQYNFKGKYFFSAAVRTDGSSRFGNGNKWGTFPSGSVAWRASKEPFLAGSEFISDLKLRASYGLTGNFQIPNYGAISLVSGSNYVFGQGDGSVASGLTPISVANANLGWEKSKMFDIGINLGLWEDRISFEADYYNSRTTNLLLFVPVPAVSGFTTALQNIGEVSNKGIELTLTGRNNFGKTYFEGSLNFSKNNNRVEKLGAEGDAIIFSSARNNEFITQVGEEVGSYFTYQIDGVYQSQAEIDNSAHYPNANVGDYKFVDVNNDGEITPNDRMITGSYQPDYTFGFSGLIRFENIDLSFTMQAVEGVEIINTLRDYIALPDGSSNVLGEFRNDEMTLRPDAIPTGNPDNPSSAWVEDGSYLALRNITLGYNFRTANIPVFSKARIYAAIQNPFIWTAYTGYNPEISSRPNNSVAQGEDLGTYPLTRVYTFGFNITF